MTGNKIELREGQVQLIEQLAVHHEKAGLQLAAGKILALLTVSDTVELTFDQIRETLSISKSATSQALNQLLASKQIEYTSRIGERKRFFHLRMTNWKEDVVRLSETLSTSAKLYEEILNQRPDDTKIFNRTLQERINIIRYMAKLLPTLVDKID